MPLGVAEGKVENPLKHAGFLHQFPIVEQRVEDVHFPAGEVVGFLPAQQVDFAIGQHDGAAEGRNFELNRKFDAVELVHGQVIQDHFLLAPLEVVQVLGPIVIGRLDRVGLVLKGEILIQQKVEGFEQTVGVREQFGQREVVNIGGILFEVSDRIFFGDGGLRGKFFDKM